MCIYLQFLTISVTLVPCIKYETHNPHPCIDYAVLCYYKYFSSGGIFFRNVKCLILFTLICKCKTLGKKSSKVSTDRWRKSFIYTTDLKDEQEEALQPESASEVFNQIPEVLFFVPPRTSKNLYKTQTSKINKFEEKNFLFQ